MAIRGAPKRRHRPALFNTDTGGPKEILPPRFSGVWSHDSRYLALNIYYGRIAFGLDVIVVSSTSAKEARFPRGEEKSMIRPEDQSRWNGEGGINSSAISWGDHDTLTVGDTLKSELKNPDGTTQPIYSERQRVVQFTSGIGGVLSTADPEY